MGGENRKRQHYVFRRYLESWQDNSGRIHVRRNGTVLAPCKTQNVAVEGYFYKLQELTLGDINLLRSFAKNCPADLHELLQDFIGGFALPIEFKKRLDPSHENYEDLLATTNREIVNLEEKIQGHIEDMFLPCLEDMLNGSVAFYWQEERAPQFLLGLCTQFLRTKRQRERLIALGPSPISDSDPRRYGNVLSHIFGLTMAFNIHQRRDLFNAVLVNNSTDTPFITSDQPIINPYAEDHGNPPKKLELYYPLSPSKAMFLIDSQTQRPTTANRREVEAFNALMVQNAHEQVFSDSSDYLRSLA